MGTRVFFCEGKSGQGVKLNTHLRLVPRSGMLELYVLYFTRLHGAVVN
jgi:hypothetical protein